MTPSDERNLHPQDASRPQRVEEAIESGDRDAMTTLLEESIYSFDEDSSAKLIAAGADPRAYDRFGTLISVALALDLTPTLEALLRAGAAPRPPPAYEHPLDHALSSGKVQV